ncbi:caspase domain-containing protein [Crepidotus variabilis]|uniref:Caspase domain-containing protein n=1 Tax=Crepidotus variabilis TaxID=179855 RepID=A0A9P6EIS7_9AGAR|nr:caspase domain-containing protein [Crepidotus variabilis]
MSIMTLFDRLTGPEDSGTPLSRCSPVYRISTAVSIRSCRVASSFSPGRRWRHLPLVLNMLTMRSELLWLKHSLVFLTRMDRQAVSFVNSKHPETPLYALLIGINNYSGISQLEGASADAQAIQRYLEDDLGVPTDQIEVLLDSQATRIAIIKAFENLANNPKIQQGDAILVFFAGHGTIVPFQAEGSVTEERIQSVLPQDFDGQVVHPIPDFTLGELIAAVHREKGDNITVILDCCYSGSGTRKAADPYINRCVTMPEGYGIPHGLDADFVRVHTRGISQVDVPGQLSTHTLLAACSAHEQAREFNGRGQFTTALLRLLESVDLSQLTYADVIDQVKISGIPNAKVSTKIGCSLGTKLPVQNPATAWRSGTVCLCSQLG